MVRIDASRTSRSRVVAVLGPTNTGKTHLAMERMLGYPSGMIGFPLRLLARENYDRAIKIKGQHHVALITGEEKIIPPEASWFLCTVEAMPVDRRVAFLGVDEIQMCADPDRGHLFTERMLHARGAVETMFMGAETIRPLLRRLVPEAEFVTRPRFSSLVHVGACKLSRLPARSAIVAFSAADVYTIAELIRRQRGGTAIVLGALSPRTRNAQVALYQAGEVDYLVATDAIGMGLNMHVDHVAFAATRKFDGRGPRPLSAAELAQIAGRAGRYTKDGTFGTTTEIGPLEADLVQRIESHQFEPLSSVQWRNTDLCFSTLAALRASLARLPTQAGLARAREADDELALAHLSIEPQIVELARGPEAIALLWEVCRIPDFGKITGEGHARLLGQLYRFLMGEDGARAGQLPSEWVARQVDRMNRTDGDLETLMQRIAGIRTWTYVAHRGNWLADAQEWQERTRRIEDKLSDALHDRLIQRFIDRRTASLVGRMQGRGSLQAAVSRGGEVHVEGHFVGHLEGFRFAPDATVMAGSGRVGEAGRSVAAAAMRALGEPIRRRLAECEADDDGAFALTAEGLVCWRGAPVARLTAGPEPLAPQVQVIASDLLAGDDRQRVRARVVRYVQQYVRCHLAVLLQAREAAGVSGAARGLIFQATEALGSMPRARAHEQIVALRREDRKVLARLGLRLGRQSVYFPQLIAPEANHLRGLLWRIHAQFSDAGIVPNGSISFVRPPTTPVTYLEAIGFRVVGGHAVRVDALERLIARAMRAARQKRLISLAELTGPLECSLDDLTAILAAVRFRIERIDSDILLHERRTTRRTVRRSVGISGTESRDNRKPGVADQRRDEQSPFSALRMLRSVR